MMHITEIKNIANDINFLPILYKALAFYPLNSNEIKEFKVMSFPIY